MADKEDKNTVYRPEDDPARRKKIRCRVHRSNVDPENKDLLITVNDAGVSNGKREFSPGQIVTLTQVQIDILRDSVETSEIVIPDGSGIYEQSNPKKAAESMYPGFQAAINPVDGTVVVRKYTPNYIIEPVA